MQPIGNRVLVRVQPEIVKKGETVAADAVMRANVLEVGKDVKEIKKGDYIVFAPYGMDEVVVGKEKLIVVSEELIIATYVKESGTKAKG